MGLIGNLFRDEREKCKDPSSLEDIQKHNKQHKELYGNGFMYLQYLIDNNPTNIILDCDIVLKEFDEEFEFRDGITIQSDNIVIDGNNHTIDARGLVRIFHIKGINITLKNFVFVNANSDKGSVIYNKRNSSLKIINCIFRDNKSITGGSIKNFGKVSVSDSKFINNFTKGEGAAINSQKESLLEIHNCEFNGNYADGSGGAIISWSDVNISNTIFKENSSKKYGGAINSNKGNISIRNSFLENNSADYDGGALINLGTLSIIDSTIKGNAAIDCGGAIQNIGNVHISGCVFENNKSFDSGGIGNNGHVNVSHSTFKKNTSEESASSIYNRNAMFINHCSFHENNSNFHVIKNTKTLKIIESDFVKNINKSVIFNEDNAILSISGGVFEENNILGSVIYNRGHECNLNHPTFKFNLSNNQYSNIYNKTTLSLQNPSIINHNPDATVYNEGQIDIRQVPLSMIKKIIYNTGCINNFTYEKEMDNDNNNFSYLDNLIHKSNKITFQSDITLDNYELDFFEGGIELDCDNLIIDGNNCCIDGKRRTRLFNITAKNIVIKNLTFKNAKVLNSYESNVNGGGAIKIAKKASLSLINCRFINCSSDNDGGVILNNGTLNSKNTVYKNNNSQRYGGAIYNNGICSSYNDLFKKNHAQLGSAVYNHGELNLSDFKIFKNHSNISQPIFNASSIKSLNTQEYKERIIYNIGLIKKEDSLIESNFSFLNKQIKNKSKIILNEDISYNYWEDKKFKKGIIINKSVIIDGMNHTINGNNLSSLFKITTIKKVILKNIIFKNFYSKENSILANESNLIIKNCRFENIKSKKSPMIINNNQINIFDSILYENSVYQLINNKNLIKIINTKIINNTSLNNLINNYKNSVMEMKNIYFFDNNITFKGSLIENSYGEITLNSNKFINSRTKSNAAVLNNSGTATIENNVFYKNRAYLSAGSILNNKKGNLIVLDSLFSENESENYDGGAIVNWGVIYINMCMFKNNKSGTSGGSLASFEYSSSKISDSNFIKNKSENGGAITNIGKMNIKNSLISGNIARRKAGAILNRGKRLVINNSTLKNNTSEEDNRSITNDSEGEIEITNTRFKENSTDMDEIVGTDDENKVIVDNCVIK